MLLDNALLAVWRDRIAHGHASKLLQQAWSGDPPELRAAEAAAVGDLPRAAAIAQGPWECLLKGDVVGALRQSRGDSKRRTPSLAFAEAEALIQAGAVVAGLERLGNLHEDGMAPATVALSRHCYRFGDFGRAMTLGQSMPGHAHLALTGAKSALLKGRDAIAEALLEPYLKGVLPLPDPLEAGAFAAVAASVLAKRRQHKQLLDFATQLLTAPDAPDDMSPCIARIAWSAGLASDAWERFQPSLGPPATLGRLELALLAGDAEAAARLSQEAGPISAPSQPALTLLRGDAPDLKEAQKLLGNERIIHIWRTHPDRWRPWIDAVRNAAANVTVCDLGEGLLPDEQVLPDVVLDDGSLASLVHPHPPPKSSPQGQGVWIEEKLCDGIGIGHDWPPDETAKLLDKIGVKRTAQREAADTWVVRAATGLAHAAEGRPMVVAAPPGDPFWAGPLPKRAWPAMQVAQADPRQGWRDQGARMGELALAQRAESTSGGAAGDA